MIWLGLWLCSLTAPLAEEVSLQRYVVGVENIDYRPYHDGRNAGFEGFGRELLDAFAAAEGLAFDYQPLPVARLLPSLLDGRIDFKYPDDPHWQPQQRLGAVLHYSQPVVESLDGTLVPDGALGQPASRIQQLGTVVGFTPVAWLDALGEGRLMLRENADFTALIRQTLIGRVDAAYANVAVVQYQLRELGLDSAPTLRFDPQLPHLRGDYRLSTSRHPDILERFDRWMLDEAEQVFAIKARHGLPDTQIPADPAHPFP
ncbi:MAG: transporter substrate-binding domain-containing protein [Chromatiaceae bacterium]|nr:transporter substrate-binding domain-containing protein [Chromatiaceae bacterium]